MVDNTLFTKKKSLNLIIVQIHVDDIIFGLTCQELCDEFAKIMDDAFKMGMMGELNLFLRLQIKQMEDGIFFNQFKYTKEMLKKFRLEDSKPIKSPMSFDTKLTKDKECESVESTKYRGMLGTTHLGLWYRKRTDIKTVVYADSDHARDYVDRKSTSGICTFLGCCLTSWFSKKKTALAIYTTKAEYVSAEKACQQVLWMKQDLIDYDVRLDDVPIMCDNKGAIDLSKNPVQHSRTKHIEIRHHFLLDNVKKGGHKDHVSSCLCHILYCIESSTPYNLAFFILKRMEKTQNKPKELLPYGMLLTRLFKHVVSVSYELALDHYLSHDRAMYPLAPHYERKTQSDHCKKRPRESNTSSSSSFTTRNHPSSSLPLDAIVDENNDESFHSNSSSPYQSISSSSNVVPRVYQNLPYESHNLNTYLSETINIQTQQRDAHRNE
nr:copia protein [Tanacetum cinerariifolium]